MRENGFKKGLSALPPRSAEAEAARAVSAFLKNSLVQINSKLNSKSYDYLY